MPSAVALALLLGLGLGCKTATAVALTIAGQPAVIIPATTPTHRVVLYLHGAGETAESLVTDPEKAGIVAALRTHGFALAASNAQGNNWGSATSVTDYLALVRYLSRRGLTRVYVLAQSMGGLDGLELLADIRPVAWAGIYPLTNLRSIVASDERQIREALGPRFSFYWHHLSPVPLHNVSRLPMIFWASPSDRVVPKALNTDLTAASARRHGAQVTVIPTEGEHGDASNFQPARLLAFYRGALHAIPNRSRGLVRSESGFAKWH